MIYEIPAQDGVPLSYKATYCFMNPCQCKVRNADGNVELVSFGIGEKVEVMEPAWRYLVPALKLKKEIPLVDGRTLVAWPNDIRVVKEYSSQV